jgi:hypothetical protein
LILLPIIGAAARSLMLDQRSEVKSLATECQTYGMYSQSAKQATKSQGRGLLVFSEIPGHTSADS